jgi:hypothetical protein
MRQDQTAFPIWLPFFMALPMAVMIWYWAPALGFDLMKGSVLEQATRLLPNFGTAAAQPTAASGSAIGAPSEAATAGDAPGAEAVAAAPFCAPGQQPGFVLGFADLKRQLGATMGEPLECEHVNPENGDTLQQTTTGLAVYQKDSNTAAFTDGWNHWAQTTAGLVQWQGTEPPALPELAGPGGR